MLMPVLSVEDHSDSPGTLTRVGETVPDFRLASVEGKPFRAVDLRGKVIVLSFFATWCGPCQKELPQLQAIWDEFHNDSDFRMLVVGREESDDSVKTYRQKHGFSFPLASDRDKSVYAKFASQYIPRTYLISREGTIVYQSAGYYEAETAKLKNLLRRELAKTE
jgi:peroxiredoxin